MIDRYEGLLGSMCVVVRYLPSGEGTCVIFIYIYIHGMSLLRRNRARALVRRGGMGWDVEHCKNRFCHVVLACPVPSWQSGAGVPTNKTPSS